ncbi:FixJ family two-component response regulator [Sphingobium sp. B1D7B]|uniref:histidine kinase n=1 Tax=Sphingobium sp. B1D7B TaxID=2940578 RepID=UPI002223F35E|nr:histidine kinase [Sphingobium sp. B1D7B]MCW2404595.1 FixJ family two-component response regulator [Sphingobium sp. B1D7B]
MQKDLVMLFENDQPVLASLQFALALEGYIIADGAAQGAIYGNARCLVIDQGYRGHGLAFLQELRASGIAAPAILLATNPTRKLHEHATSKGVVVIEKPLLGDELAETLRTLCQTSDAA